MRLWVWPPSLRRSRAASRSNSTRQTGIIAHARLLTILGDFLLQLLERHAWTVARKPTARKMIVFEILDIPQDRLARIEALGAAGLLGKHIETLLHLGRQ